MALTVRATILQAPAPVVLEVLEDQVITLDHRGRRTPEGPQRSSRE